MASARQGNGRNWLFPVTVVVPAYRTAIDTGTSKFSVDALGDTWGPDRKHATGSYGYLGSAGELSTPPGRSRARPIRRSAGPPGRG
jgi:hypothetical protein